MCKGLIAKKVGMSRIFLENGDALPVTYLEVKPNTVIRTKTEDKDGYNAVVLGTGAKKWKSRKGKEHTRYKNQKEWQVESLDGLDAGTEVTCKNIPAESVVTISGTSKGKGFQGVIKRHKFSRGPETHGSHHHREPGSIGNCEFPSRVQRGKKMPGRMGNDTITLRNRSVVFCDPAKSLLAVKGPVPGPNGATVYLTVESAPEVVDAKPPKEVEKEEPKKGQGENKTKELNETKKKPPKEEVKKEEKKEVKEVTNEKKTNDPNAVS